MVAILADENFHQAILDGLKQRLPTVDAVHAHEVGIRGLADPELLQLASELGRLVLTHDRRTMIDFAYQRIAQGLPFSGLVLVPRAMSLGRAIDELELLIGASKDDELRGQVKLLPLG